MRNHPWQSYKKVAAQTATPGQLVLMLYEGAIRFLDQACLGFAEEDPLLYNQTINNNILKAQAILHELDASLDMDRGGDFSRNLRSLYAYLTAGFKRAISGKTRPASRKFSTGFPCSVTHGRRCWREDPPDGKSWRARTSQPPFEIRISMTLATVCEALDSGRSLVDLYRQWHDLTLTEGQAIRAAAWTQVEQLQETKYRLQPRIVEAMETLHREVSLCGADGEAVDRELRSIVSELISGEKLNIDLLGEQRSALESHRAELDRSSRNLRQVHRAYSGVPATAWCSYS